MVQEGRQPGTLLGRRSAGGLLVCHELAPPAHLAETYRRAGQYVELTLAGKRTFFALAGEPLAATWEIFVRPGGDVADALLAAPLGGDLGLSAALGAGFPLEEAASKRLFVLATGSGIAAVRPVLNHRVRTGQAPATEVFLGVPRRADLPMPDEVARWTASGVAITVCLSQEPAAEVGAAEGYVQDALRRRAAISPARLATAMVFAAGTPAMVRDARKLATTLGLTEADIRTNY